MLGACYMPPTVRIPHTLEILADSFAYAGVLVVLLGTGSAHLVQRVKETMISQSMGRNRLCQKDKDPVERA